MKGLIPYRVLTVLLNILCAMCAISLLFSLPLLFVTPLMSIVYFIIISLILYAWYANKFLKKVVIQQTMFTRKEKDWLNVNAIVSLIFAVLLVLGTVSVLNNPASMKTITAQTPVTSTMIGVYLVYGLIIFLHVTWTLILLRRNRDMIEP